MRFQNILVRATNWLGDAVMSLPALQQLRARHDGARISVLARSSVGDLYRRESFCDELIVYEAEKGWHDLNAKRKLAAELNSRRFDCAILFQNAFEAAALTWWARVPVRIGYDRDARGLLLTHAVAVPKPNEAPKHQRFYYLELLKRAGLIEDYDVFAPIQLSETAAARAQGKLRLREFAGSKSVLAVSPGAAFGSAKRWLPERFAQAAVSIANTRQAAVVVLGSKAEREICDVVAGLVNAAGVTCRNMAGATSLEDFIEIAAGCELMLTNDSGAMHISSALGVPTLAVFGATDAEATGPTGEWARVIQQKVECSPCGFRECPIDHRCMTRVDVERVVVASAALVEARKNSA